MSEVHIPSDAVIVRFGMATPFWPLSMSYGMFFHHNLKMWFHCPDHYIAYMMLARNADRSRISKTPNGYLSHQNLIAILDQSREIDGDPVINPHWETSCDDVMREALQLKFSQHSALTETLIRTGGRSIVDASRKDDTYWCWSEGEGQNKHGKLLQELRDNLSSSEMLPLKSRLSQGQPQE